ncbi:hypothetical protein PV328_003902 [Microctonus aethiopoides]|uniref:RING-type domain-containing protein n=1 Tax=Microctonus aethiopoides TaxID=144406 RepID=A0AA39KL57_9HYME|nr:hypothetical protein PV328_003902 [Microctonus aethiopoides]
MQELILCEYEEINSLLYKPIITTQRIKYTCINTSTNYIVLGSTSGSLYLFTREPCIFQQLIPLSEGPVIHLLISPDEKTIALATKRGSVCIINLKPTIKLLSVLNEHINETITCLCWNEKSTEIYVGDCNGKISTIVLSIFTVNGMFQPPTCTLMHLDSTIVQMDFSMRYLLVSTLTRCYICDTAHEQFKQIGNKARDGEYGGCFYKIININQSEKKLSNTENDKILNKTSGINSIIGLSDEMNDEQQNLIVYCARPGCRLWEVTTNGIVIKTHQFKDALPILSSNIYITPTIKLLQQSINNKNDKQQFNSNPSHNFSRLIVVNKKYLLSYTTNSLYIIDPINATVILWTDEFTNIAMIHIIDDKIYLMTLSGLFHCLTLSNVDTLIIKLFNCKLYNDCLQLCMVYRGELLKSINGNDKIIKITDDDEKFDLSNLQINDVTTILQQIISAIQRNSNAHPQRLNSGIVVVHSGNGLLCSEKNYRSLTPTETKMKLDDNNYKKNDYESLSDTEIVYDNSVRVKKNIVTQINQEQRQQSHQSVDENICNNMSQINFKDCDNLEKSIESNNRNDNSTANELRRKEIEITASNIQLDLEPVNILISTLKSSTTEMNAEHFENIICQIGKIIVDINNKYDEIIELKQFLYEIIRSIERNYYHILLENITIKLLSATNNICVLNEINKAFIDLNTSNYLECSCENPQMNNQQLSEPKFVEIGQTLIEKFIKENNNEKFISLIKYVPYFWREYLLIYVNKNGLIDDNIIRLCLQTQDNIIISILLPLLNTKQWKIAIECIERMKINHCLFCNIKFNSANNSEIDWNGVAHEIIVKQKSDSALKFIKLLETKLPSIKFKQNVYQSLIFNKLLNHHGYEHAVKFDHDKLSNSEFSSVCSPEVRNVLVEALEKDLKRPIDKNIFGTGPYHWGIRFNKNSSTCPACTLSLKTPVLLGENGISIFPCGHAYHVNCLVEKKLTTCFLHQ